MKKNRSFRDDAQKWQSIYVDDGFLFFRRSRTLQCAQNSTGSSGNDLLIENIIPRPTKSDSDSGVHTQPEEIPISTNLSRRRHRFPMPTSVVYSTTSQSRWLVNRSTSQIAESRSRLLLKSHQHQHYQRSDGYRYTIPLPIAGDEASCSASSTNSSASLSTSSASSSFFREPRIQNRTVVLKNMLGGGCQRIATPTSSTSEEIDVDDSKKRTVVQ